MTGASKILTVSYGTFSCTLEGFDNPFNTMKAIAEYFRDLAADDRYFGAEPPQPDAAMLHKIAEREIQRRVEAKIESNGVTLRAGPENASTDPVVDAEDAPRPVVHMPATTVPRPPAPGLAGADTVTASVAEKLSRMRQAADAQESPGTPETMASLSVSHDSGLAPYAPAQGDFDDLDSAEDDDDFYEEANSPLMPAGQPAPAPDSGAAQGLAQDADSDDAQHDAVEADKGTDDNASDVIAPEAGAAKTDIADVSSPEVSDDDDAAHDDRSDDDTAAAVLAALGVDNAKAAPVAAPDMGVSAVAGDDTALLAALGQLIDPEQDDFDDTPSDPVIADTMEADDSLTKIAALPEPETITVITPEAEPAPAAPASPVEADGATPGADGPAQQPAPRPVRPVRPARSEAMTEQPSPAPQAEAAPEGDAAPQSDEPAPITLATLQRARARVIKIRRGDATIVQATQTTTTATVAPTASPEKPAPRRTLLSDEAEAALAAELAALEADTAVPETPAQPRATLAPAGEEAVNRLMLEANSQMDGADTKRRQSAIAHLKAAVAATVAERKATGNTLSGDGKGRLDAYRSDLAAMVRPNDADTQVDPRAVPLVLVSEQRIDRPAPAQTVMPRRVAPAATRPTPAFEDEVDFDDLPQNEAPAPTNVFRASDGFADFADRLGANGLPGLLEAAAAYIACVEGRDSFTRPQLMRHIAETQGFAGREDGLRSFGVLLRDGVIEKTRRGQFALSERSTLLAEARKIAG